MDQKLKKIISEHLDRMISEASPEKNMVVLGKLVEELHKYFSPILNNLNIKDVKTSDDQPSFTIVITGDVDSRYNHWRDELGRHDHVRTAADTAQKIIQKNNGIFTKMVRQITQEIVKDNFLKKIFVSETKFKINTSATIIQRVDSGKRDGRDNLYWSVESDGTYDRKLNEIPSKHWLEPKYQVSIGIFFEK